MDEGRKSRSERPLRNIAILKVKRRFGSSHKVTLTSGQLMHEREKVNKRPQKKTWKMSC